MTYETEKQITKELVLFMMEKDFITADRENGIFYENYAKNLTDTYTKIFNALVDATDKTFNK